MTTNKVIDIRTKKSANLITQSDEDQVNWLVNELCGVINKAEKKKFNDLGVLVNKIHAMLNRKDDVFDIITEASKDLASISDISSEEIQSFDKHLRYHLSYLCSHDL